ncbi:MAG: hypothetical protein AB7L92_01785 [Alphaproteobacteria bacterium]
MKESWQRFIDKHRGNAATKETVLKAYQNVLGERRAVLENDALVLRFNTKNALEFIQSERTIESLRKRQVPCETSVGGDDIIISIPLSGRGHEDNLNILENVAQHIAVKVQGAGARQLVTPLDGSHPIVDATKVPWQIVHNSPYGVPTLEPKRDTPIPPDKRRKEEFALGYALYDKQAMDSRGDVTGWLRHQQEVEEGANVEVHTAIPEDWVSGETAGRLIDKRKQLRGVFRE